ncbi:MAG: protein O-GlcNAc transferase [Phycisphaerales bacterium]
MSAKGKSGPGGEAVVKALQAAHALHASGKADEAIVAVRRALAKDPAHADGARMLSQMLLAQGRVDEARFALARALKAGRPDAALLVASAQVEAMGGETDAALAAIERAMELSPGLPGAMAVRGRLLMGRGRLSEAVADLRAASEALPAEPEHRNNLALALLATAHAPEACELLRALAREQPGFLPARATLAQAMNYHPTATAQEVFAAHVAYGELCESQHPPMPVSPGALGPEAMGNDRPIRVGFLSRDLRRHSCAYFLLPILEHLDRERFQPIAYMDDPHADEMTERLRGLFEQDGEWHEISRMTNGALAEQIQRDRVGVLLDLGGHFFGTRLGVMAHKPAPVSVSYLAYPNTTGLTRVDARLVDAMTDPEDGADELATERLIRIGEGTESLWCYRADEGLPEAEALSGKEPFTFVSFNDLKKVNDSLLDDWCEILNRVPSSRLIVKTGALGDDAVRAEVAGRFESRGVTAGVEGVGERVELLGHTESHAAHLKLYRRAHAALDTHPYCGTTTTLEAAWMGVPTVTLAGQTHAARVGLSLNTALGLEGFVAESREAYVALAIGLTEDFGRDPSGLNALRAGLRQRFESGGLSDEKVFVKRFERGLAEAMRIVRG